MEPAAKKPRVMSGPCVWWVRNDLRLQDNPALRAVNGAALVDKRNFVCVYVFDRRNLDACVNGFSVTDFSGKKTKALHARFVRQSVLALRDELAAAGSKLLICHGKPEDILPALPAGSEVKCQHDHFQMQDYRFCNDVAASLIKGGSKLRTDFGATGLYHPHELFMPKDLHDRYGGLGALGKVLGWKDILKNGEREDNATHVRPVVSAPSRFSPPMEDLQLPGLIPADVLADETALLKLLGYSSEEITEAQSHMIPQGGEPAARDLLVDWVKNKNWAKAYPDFVNYMMMGCISAREIFSHAEKMPDFAEVARHLVWRDFHRFHNEAEDTGPQLRRQNSGDKLEEMKVMKAQIDSMQKKLEMLGQGIA